MTVNDRISELKAVRDSYFKQEISEIDYRYKRQFLLDAMQNQIEGKVVESSHDLAQTFSDMTLIDDDLDLFEKNE